MAASQPPSGSAQPPPAEAPPPPADLPSQRRGTTPQMRGRYPDYDVLETVGHWDGPTRAVVLARVGAPPPIRFFDEAEARTLGAFCDIAMAQDSEPRIPVLAMVDQKLHEHRREGYRHADMPSDGEVWRAIARMLDDAAVGGGASDLPGADPVAVGRAGERTAAHGGAGFAAAPANVQREIVGRFAKGELEWDAFPVAKAWSLAMRDVVSAFYSHPWAWNEIGFGGPAYPRGYARLGPGQREHWESPPEFETDPVADVKQRGLE